MNIGIISINSAFPAQTEKENILGLNGKLSENGLIISENQALSIAEARESSLQSNGRIEFSGKTAEKIILEFGKSACIDRDTFADTVCELIDIFYYLRNGYPETRLSDDRAHLGDERVLRQRMCRRYRPARRRGSRQTCRKTQKIPDGAGKL